MLILRALTFIILTWVFIYTLSYARWVWKKKNRLGAIMVFLVAIIALVLPVYSIFFR